MYSSRLNFFPVIFTKSYVPIGYIVSIPLILSAGTGSKPPIPPPTATDTLSGFKKVNLAANREDDEKPVKITFSFIL